MPLKLLSAIFPSVLLAHSLYAAPPASADLPESTAAASITWSEQFGGEGNDAGSAAATDLSGNIFVASTFSGSASFGDKTFAGGKDLLLTKYAPSGAHLWSRRFGAAGDESASSIALDSAGSIIIGGSFTGTANFGTTNFVSAGQQDCFLAKYSPNGTALWARQIGGVYPDVINSVAVDSQGNIIITGFFQAQFGAPVDFGGTGLFSWNTGLDSFVAKYSPSGSLIFAFNFYNNGTDSGSAVAVDKTLDPATHAAHDDIILAGYFQGLIDLGTGNITTPGGYIVKFTPAGKRSWSNVYGVSNPARILAMAVDSAGDIAVAGDFYQKTDLGGALVTGGALQNDAFVAKYSGVNGAHLWSHALPGTLSVEPTSLTIDLNRNIFLAGYFHGNATIGALEVSTGLYGTNDGFVAKYSPAGGVLSALSFGGTGNDQPNGITTDPLGYAVVTGGFAGQSNFAGKMLLSNGSGDSFLFRIDPKL